MRIRLVISTLLLVTFPGGCEPTARKYHEEGLTEYRAGRYESARAMFKEALLLAPERQDSAYYLARCARHSAEQKFYDGDIPGAMRELDDAAFYYGQAIEAYPGYAAAIEEKTAALELKGRYAEALRLSIWAKENAGRTVRQLVNVARKYEQRGDMDGALTGLRQAVAIEPDSALAQAEMGRFFARQQRYQEAVVALERAYELSPSEPGVATDLARCRSLAGGEVRQASTPVPPETKN